MARSAETCSFCGSGDGRLIGHGWGIRELWRHSGRDAEAPVQIGPALICPTCHAEAAICLGETAIGTIRREASRAFRRAVPGTQTCAFCGVTDGPGGDPWRSGLAVHAGLAICDVCVDLVSEVAALPAEEALASPRSARRGPPRRGADVPNSCTFCGRRDGLIGRGQGIRREYRSGILSHSTATETEPVFICATCRAEAVICLRGTTIGEAPREGSPAFRRAAPGTFTCAFCGAGDGPEEHPSVSGLAVLADVAICEGCLDLAGQADATNREWQASHPDAQRQPVGMPTPETRRALILAQQAAAQAGHPGAVRTEDLLLGLLGVAEGSAAKVLTTLGVGTNAVATVLLASGDRREQEVARREGASTSPAVTDVIKVASEEAARSGATQLGTEHLLLGLLIEGKGRAAGTLADLGVSLERVRRELTVLSR
jgi:hypothetical protein